tara:strand:+ start:146 stop:1216 length:1071 start_codon:yes stop_codon:yes gene_type:complete
MAKKFTIEILMDLAKSIGANPQKFMGTKTNITFLGKGPTKHSLFQKYLPLRAETPVESLGRPESLVSAVENAMGYATAGKLNSIQTEILGTNMLNIKNILKPPALPLATITKFPKQGSGITGIRTPDNSTLISGHTTGTGRPINRISTIGKPDLPEPFGTSRLPKPGPGDIQAFQKALDAKTGMSRAIARELLLKDTRLNLPDDVLKSLRTGSRGEDPLDIMKRYYGQSMLKYDDFLNDVMPRPNMDPRSIATRILSEVELIPQFAEGGLADIMQTPRRGRVTHPGGYAGSKRQAFIDLAARGGSRQDFIDLANSFMGQKPPVKDPFENLTIYDMLMSGALESELKDGGLAKILEV